MEYPPNGDAMHGPRKDLDESDKDIISALAKDKRCQQRIITDRGQHYIYCGGYFHGKAIKTKDGYRCEYHR